MVFSAAPTNKRPFFRASVEKSATETFSDSSMPRKKPYPFSFKNIGSYKSTNLAVSETEKQDIRWESNSVKNELFN